AARLDHLRPMGLHVHLGSQIGSVATYLEAVAWLAGFIDREGLGGLPLLDLGGGLAIAYADGDTAPDVGEAVAATAAGVAGRPRGGRSCGPATSSRSPPPAPTRRRWRRPTTACPGPRRSWSPAARSGRLSPASPSPICSPGSARTRSAGGRRGSPWRSPWHR